MTLDFADGDRTQTLARVLGMAPGAYGYVVTPNVDHVVKLMDGRVGREVYEGAALKVCDSRILSHLARLRGVTLPVYPGSDMTADLLASPAAEELVIAVFGPDRAAAQIEASKAYSKALMERAGVPTARSRTFTELPAARAYVATHPEPLVVKASGLAAGKGAVVCQTRREADETLAAMLGEGKFGEAGKVVVIEDFMPGEELSLLAITNGDGIELLPAAQDHKRLGEGDQGPNTGGMGAYAPVALATPALLERARREVLVPTLAQLAKDGAPYNGVLYAGLMLGPDGTLRVVEFNCRLGDPETQVVLPLVEGGLVDCLRSVARGTAPTPLRIGKGAAVTTEDVHNAWAAWASDHEPESATCSSASPRTSVQPPWCLTRPRTETSVSTLPCSDQSRTGAPRNGWLGPSARRPRTQR